MWIFQARWVGVGSKQDKDSSIIMQAAENLLIQTFCWTMGIRKASPDTGQSNTGGGRTPTGTIGVGAGVQAHYGRSNLSGDQADAVAVWRYRSATSIRLSYATAAVTRLSRLSLSDTTGVVSVLHSRNFLHARSLRAINRNNFTMSR